MRIEEFPIDSKKAKKLIETFNQMDYIVTSEKSEYVYVNFSMVRLQIMWVLPKLFYAMGVAKETNAQVIAITWRRNKLFDELLSSLGIVHLCIEDMNHKSICSLFKSLGITANFMLRHKTGSELQDLKMNGLPLGQMLYEDIIRTSSLSTIKSVRNKICIKKMLHITWMICALRRYLKYNKPIFCVADDIAYHEALQNAVFYSFGATIYSQHIYGESKVIIDSNNKTVRRGKMLNEIIKQKVENVGEKERQLVDELLKAKFGGKAGRDIDRDAFLGKRVVDRKNIEKILNLKKGKKNVVIMAHTFTDAVFNYGDLYFRDYYDWLEQTLKIASKVNTVNWILKPHPSRDIYNERDDSIEDMFDRLKIDGMYMLPDNISAESIRDIADVIITIGGNAGGEFSCFGIPTIIVGEPYYKGFGYTIEPETKEKYISTLYNIDSIQHLDIEQIKIAKNVYYLNSVTKLGKSFHDEFAEILLKKNGEMSDKIAKKLFGSNEGTSSYNNEIIDRIIEFFNNHKIEDSEYYQRGIQRGKEWKEMQIIQVP